MVLVNLLSIISFLLKISGLFCNFFLLFQNIFTHTHIILRNLRWSSFHTFEIKKLYVSLYILNGELDAFHPLHHYSWNYIFCFGKQEVGTTVYRKSWLLLTSLFQIPHESYRMSSLSFADQTQHPAVRPSIIQMV